MSGPKKQWKLWKKEQAAKPEMTLNEALTKATILSWHYGPGFLFVILQSQNKPLYDCIRQIKN